MGKPRIANAANAITLFGFAVTIFGATRINTVEGIIITAFGRIMDIVDGKVARALHQESVFGAMLDATCDKFGVLAIIIAEWHFSIAPWYILLSILLLNLANAISAYIITQVKHELHIPPSRTGKNAMFLQNLGLGAFALAYVVSNQTISSIVYGIGFMLVLVGIFILGIPNTVGYYKIAFSLKKK